MFTVPSLPKSKKTTQGTQLAQPITAPEVKPPVRMMFTRDEVRDFTGKQRNLTRLMETPNAQSPVFTYPLAHLVFCLDMALAWKGSLFDEGVRGTLNHSLKCMQIMENILIRSIVQGDDYWNLINEEIAKPGGEFLVDFQMHESGRNLFG